MQRHRALIALALAWMTLSVRAADGTPQFLENGRLQLPADYRQWVFVTSGLGMTYGPARPAPGQPPHFGNVFVSPEAYETFMDTGRWPEGTAFILEVRRSQENVSIAAGGHTQGARVVLEAAVKDSRRFPEGGWAYFVFDGEEPAAPLARSASCYSCHSTHGAVEWTFTQFYPELFEVARKLGTVRSDYDQTRKLE